ncbi:MAG: hypothetical protein NTV86_19230 [Planctomycetota bacterium]|nr:hypothetical protein [Planctomycetota bacterium]
MKYAHGLIACTLVWCSADVALGEIPWPGYPGPPTDPVIQRANSGPSLGEVLWNNANELMRDTRAVKNAVKAGQNFVPNKPPEGALNVLVDHFTPGPGTMPPDKLDAIKLSWTGRAANATVKLGDALSYLDLGIRIKTAVQNGSTYELGRETAAWQGGRMAAGAAATFTVGWLTALSAPPVVVLAIGAGGAYVASQGTQYLIRTTLDGAKNLTNTFVTYLTTPTDGGSPPILQPLADGLDGFMPLMMDPALLPYLPQGQSGPIRLVPLTGNNYGGTGSVGPCTGFCPK